MSNKEYPIMIGKVNLKDQSNKRKFDLQERFIDYAVRIIKVSEKLPETKAGKHICSQILRRDNDVCSLDIGYSVLDIGYSK
jgi:hypothetical protein